MGRLWTAGAELQTATAGIEFSAITTNAPAIETSTKRSGNAAYRITNSGGAEGFRQQHTSAQGQFFFRFYLYIVALPTATAVIGGSRQTGANKAVIRLTTGGALQLYNFEDSAQVGSDSSALSTGTWYRIELMYDSTTLATTSVEAKIDGTTFASGTIDITATPNSFGCYTTGGDATLDYIVDDLAINDTSGSFQNTWPGEGEVIVLRPNGNGDNSDWGGSDGNSTDNYLLIDETPPDTADYVEDNTSGQIDDYAMESTPAAMDSSDTINVVHVGVYAAVSDATGGDPDIVLRIKAASAGTVEESSNLDCNSTTYQGPAPLPANANYQLTLYDLPGASTTAWTKADLDAMQAGIRVSVTDTHFARVAALWVMVDHSAAAGSSSVSVSDSVSVAESVIADVSDPQVNASDAVGVAENKELLITSFVGVNDSIGLAESATAEVSAPQVNASDTVGVAENVSLAVLAAGTSAVSVSDHITLTENVVLVVSGPQVHVSEAIGLAESSSLDGISPPVPEAGGDGTIYFGQQAYQPDKEKEKRRRKLRREDEELLLLL